MMSATELPFVVKICGITNEEDARVAIEGGANALGFNFYPKSPRYITPLRARQIANAIEGAFLKVGVFVNQSAAALEEVAGQVPLDVVQLHGDRCAIRASTSYRIWRSIGPDALPHEPDPDVEAYLIDTPAADFGGSGRTFDWSLAKGLRCRVIVAGGLDGSNVEEAIRTVLPWGVDACSRLELKRGKKDRQKICEFVRAARAASREMRKAVL